MNSRWGLPVIAPPAAWPMSDERGRVLDFAVGYERRQQEYQQYIEARARLGLLITEEAMLPNTPQRSMTNAEAIARAILAAEDQPV